MSDSLAPHELQHTRLLCPPLFPEVCSNSCLLSQWCYLSISSSVTPFSFCLQSFPASRSFPMSRLFALGSLSISSSNGYSRLIYFRIDWFDLLAVQRTLKSLLQHHSSKALIIWCCVSYLSCVAHSHTFSGLREHLCIISQLSKSKVGVGSSGFHS